MRKNSVDLSACVQTEGSGTIRTIWCLAPLTQDNLAASPRVCEPSDSPGGRPHLQHMNSLYCTYSAESAINVCSSGIILMLVLGFYSGVSGAVSTVYLFSLCVVVSLVGSLLVH
jgi:hypothetical protein